MRVLEALVSQSRTTAPRSTSGYYLRYGQARVLGAVVPVYNLIVIAASVAIAAGLGYMLTRTAFGRIIRAAADNREMAQALGVDMRSVYARVFTLDLHQANNYPIKQPASMNVGLPDDCGDDEYLGALEAALAEAVARHEPDFVHYVAGGDPYEGDQLGGLALTKEGLRRRDSAVLDVCSRRKLPLVATLAGGYAARTEDLVEIHANLVTAMAEAA